MSLNIAELIIKAEELYHSEYLPLASSARILVQEYKDDKGRICQLQVLITSDESEFIKQ